MRFFGANARPCLRGSGVEQMYSIFPRKRMQTGCRGECMARPAQRSRAAAGFSGRQRPARRSRPAAWKKKEVAKSADLLHNKGNKNRQNPRPREGKRT